MKHHRFPLHRRSPRLALALAPALAALAALAGGPLAAGCVVDTPAPRASDSGGNDSGGSAPGIRVPERFAFYYGQPSGVNGAAGDTALATRTFADYDIVVLGDGLEEITHIDHERTQTIIGNLKASGTRVFGYVDLCVMGGPTCTNLPLSEIQAKADRWRAMGVAGIFLDQAGYDYHVSRDRLNAAVDYLHANGLAAFVNPWVPDDVFSPAVNATLNPAGTATHLGASDYSLHESFAVELARFQDAATLAAKADRELGWKRELGTKIAVVNTLAQGAGFDQAKFEYVWWMALDYDFDAMAWGETWAYSAENNALPFHPRPAPANLGRHVDPVVVDHSSNVYARQTTQGTIEVDTATHVGRYVPRP
jgi:hypothetical protein